MKWVAAAVLIIVPLILFGAREGEALLQSEPEVRVLFVGDMLFDRQIRLVAEQKGEDHIFSCIEGLFERVDFAVGNLEGPITSHASRSAGSVIGSPDNFVFTFPTTTALLLKRHNFAAVNLGNNHIGNMGWEGIASTRSYLEEAGVGYFGGLTGQEDVYRTEIGGVPLSFVNYNEFGGAKPGDVALTITNEKSLDRVVVVYTHWGDEYIDSRARLYSIAKLFAESGASLIIGSHPHVVLPSETIGDTVVYYSLGNFIFDQYFDEKVKNGLAVEVVLSKDGAVDIVERPVSLNRNGTTCPIVQEAAV